MGERQPAIINYNKKKGKIENKFIIKPKSELKYKTKPKDIIERKSFFTLELFKYTIHVYYVDVFNFVTIFINMDFLS